MDWNQDGKKDLIIGDSDGYIYTYINTAADNAPLLAAGEKLKVNGNVFGPDLLKEQFGDTLKYFNRAKPEVVDWNNDSKADLLVGIEEGYVLLLLNTGAKGAPLFKTITFIKDGDKNLRPGTSLMRVDPRVYDWNADGKKDLLLADEKGNVHYFENKGTDFNPVFNGSVLLEVDGVPLKGGPRSRLDIVDWNKDGQPDLLYGSKDENFDAQLHLYLAATPDK